MVIFCRSIAFQLTTLPTTHNLPIIESKQVAINNEAQLPLSDKYLTKLYSIEPQRSTQVKKENIIIGQWLMDKMQFLIVCSIYLQPTYLPTYNIPTYLKPIYLQPT